ncbi:rRNA-processing protein UTP23 homolog [Agrilus planipennis]|uniref:rRNA-processing protein UTP23 homolog n=1 Tax=Agrilus planipennis TaxID=224129 RepID=A0A1W4WQC1_AGRPL|nr:rRNA-processing protein UTP23 homolog [Agrilus planipennis]
MKIKRHKKVHKDISFYVNYFHFRPPYQIIVDGTFCFAALNNKINIKDNIPKYLQDNVKFLTTQCVIIESELLGKKVFGALLVLKQFALHKCGHEGKPVSAVECLLSMVGQDNSNHYIFATQDRDLQKKLRQTPGVPLLFLHQKTPVLEHPSQASIQKANEIKQQRFSLSKEEIDKLEKIKESHGIDTIMEIPRKRKRKGPNPLSCKKKKTNTKSCSTGEDKDGNNKKKHKKKVRVSKHIKELLKEQSTIN